MSTEPLLELHAVSSGYEGSRAEWDRPVIAGLDLRIEQGELVTLLGPNGSGKSCVLLALAGLLKITGGSIEFRGADVTRMPAEIRARSGISLVPEGRRLFAGMTVRENLRLAATSLGRSEADGIALVIDLFPQLRGLLDKTAGSLSGGEQQMCAIGRGLMARPSLLMIDELSLGLAPVVVERLIEAVKRVNRELGITVLFVEQGAELAIDVAERVVVLSLGRKVFDASAAEAVASRDTIERAYLGLPI
jgi:branched-chain amino acid transport system ATP-binding protein